MILSQELLDDLLTQAEQVFLEEGVSETNNHLIAKRSGVPLASILELYPNPLDLQVAMLNREFTRMYQGILSDIERDPQGGLLSRMYTYIFTQVYERPVARTLYMIDRSALHDLMSHQHAQNYVPSLAIQFELMENLHEAGMLKPDIDLEVASSAITVISGGLALTAPHANLGEIVGVLMGMLGQAFDADVPDTTPGKHLFYAWATSLDSSIRPPLAL